MTATTAGYGPIISSYSYYHALTPGPLPAIDTCGCMSGDPGSVVLYPEDYACVVDTMYRIVDCCERQNVDECAVSTRCLDKTQSGLEDRFGARDTICSIDNVSIVPTSSHIPNGVSINAVVIGSVAGAIGILFAVVEGMCFVRRKKRRRQLATRGRPLIIGFDSVAQPDVHELQRLQDARAVDPVELPECTVISLTEADRRDAEERRMRFLSGVTL